MISSEEDIVTVLVLSVLSDFNVLDEECSFCGSLGESQTVENKPRHNS